MFVYFHSVLLTYESVLSLTVPDLVTTVNKLYLVFSKPNLALWLPCHPCAFENLPVV
jgi:hypothetical protein